MDDFQPITAMWARNAAQWGDLVAVRDVHRVPPVELTYRQLHEAVQDFAAGLKAAGLQQGNKVCLFAESSSRWIVADQGILLNGAADAVRGSSSPVDELAFITQHSGSCALVLQDRATLVKLLPTLLAGQQGQQGPQPFKFIAMLWQDEQQQPGSRPASRAASSSSSSSGSEEYQQAVAQLEAAGVAVLGYEAVRSAGGQLRAGGRWQAVGCSRSSLATLVYTSGTTGHPKGVCLSHGNLAYQVNHLDYFLQVSPGDSSLSLLPPWHIYQRTAAYYLFSRGACEVFSSLRTFRDDLAAYPPDHFVCVPLVLDSLHSKVMAKLKAEATGAKGAIVAALLAASAAHVAACRTVAGLDLTYARASAPAAVQLAALVTMAVTTPLYALAQNLVFSKVRAALGVRKTIVSGGGSLPPHLDSWYEALGLPVLNGWGLSETSPVLACRRLIANVRGSVGLPVPGTRLLVVDPTSHKPLPDGQQGLILAAGPGVMAGYYNDAAATCKAFIDGWFDTGDLGWRAPAGVAGSNMAGHIVLSGRAKDTIVLLSGKNVEPAPIEAALERCPLIKHALLLGQDRRELGALVFPDEEALAATGGLDGDEDEQLQALLAREVPKYNSTRPDYRPEDHIGHIQVIRAPLSVESGTLTRTMKPRRPAIMELYAPQVAALLGRLRG